jgi:3',5'-cyclic AMP phosphodiesterase CpdA
MLSVKANPAGERQKKSTAPKAHGDEVFLLAHLSDPHLSSLSGVRPASLLNKRLLGYLSWRRRRRRIHSPHILEALLQDLAAAAPDHVAVTGDLTHLGLPEEFSEAARWLARLGPPQAVTVVPGNHDTYVRSPFLETFAKWAPYLAADEEEFTGLYPSLRVRGPAALIGLSSARPSAPFMAVGSLGHEQLTRLEKLLVHTAHRGLLRIVLLHHPPVAGSILWRKRLTDTGPLARVLSRQGAELILHGHAHVSLTRELVAGDRRIPVLGVPSASDSGTHPQRAARYHLYRFARESGEWTLRLTVRVYSQRNERFLTAEEREILLPVLEE